MVPELINNPRAGRLSRSSPPYVVLLISLKTFIISTFRWPRRMGSDSHPRKKPDAEIPTAPGLGLRSGTKSRFSLNNFAISTHVRWPLGVTACL